MTGKAVIKGLRPRNVEIRTMVHRESQREEILSAGATEAVVGNAHIATLLLGRVPVSLTEYLMNELSND